MLKAPFPYAGGKSSVAATVWARLGRLDNYVEPLCGSAAMLLARPQRQGIETINDLDGFISNAYRAIRHDPEAVAAWCDWPVSECDLHARHLWLLTQREQLTDQLCADPDFYDAKTAGWWIWGACCWIGSGWCSGDGPWHAVDGQLVHLGDAGQGIHRQLVHLSDAGQGIHRQLVHLGNAGRVQALTEYLCALAGRLRDVRIACGDWTRVVGPSSTWRHGITGIFLDPPYRTAEHSFGYVTGSDIWDECWDWAMTHGTHPQLRIALCSYDDGRRLPSGWSVIRWKSRGGYGSQGDGRGRHNASREIVYFSPACLHGYTDLPLFTGEPSSLMVTE